MHEALKQNQHLLLSGKGCPLTVGELKKAEALMNTLPYENIISGDAGDIHKLQVGRFRRDIEVPIDLHPASVDLFKIINSPKMQAFYQDITGFQAVCIRRAQANILNAGDYVGVHIDGEGNSRYKGTHIDYKFAVVLHFGLAYEEGDTIIYPEKAGAKHIRLPEYSMFIITGALAHEVSPVKTGIRKTIAYFLSDNFGTSEK